MDLDTSDAMVSTQTGTVAYTQEKRGFEIRIRSRRTARESGGDALWGRLWEGAGRGGPRRPRGRGGRGAAAAAVRGWTPRLGSGGPAAVRGEGRASGREAAAQRSEFWPKNQNSDFQNSDFKIRKIRKTSECFLEGYVVNLYCFGQKSEFWTKNSDFKIRKIRKKSEFLGLPRASGRSPGGGLGGGSGGGRGSSGPGQGAVGGARGGRRGRVGSGRAAFWVPWVCSGGPSW